MSAKRDISCFISAFAEIHKKPDGCGPVLFHKKPIICIMRLFAFVPFVPYRAGTYARQTGVSKAILTRHRRAPALRLRLRAPPPASGGRLPLVAPAAPASAAAGVSSAPARLKPSPKRPYRSSGFCFKRPAECKNLFRIVNFFCPKKFSCPKTAHLLYRSPFRVYNQAKSRNRKLCSDILPYCPFLAGRYATDSLQNKAVLNIICCVSTRGKRVLTKMKEVYL